MILQWKSALPIRQRSASLPEKLGPVFCFMRNSEFVFGDLKEV
jgi:hypothetical protein